MPAPKKNTALASVASEETLAALRNEFPVEAGFQSITLPRLAFKSQDVTEGKGRSMTVTVEAGTFLDEYQTDEEDTDTGKKKWASEELGKEIEGVIVYQRKQLKMYDEAAQKYSSTPIYDTDDEVIPLFRDKERIAEGTAKELQAMYMGVNKRTGKPQSDLEENYILYILHNGELKQMNLRGSSMYAAKSYKRSTHVPSVLTHFSSEEKDNGKVSWNCMKFTAVRPLNAEEAEDVLSHMRELKSGISAQKEAFAQAKPVASATPHPLDNEFSEDDLPALGS